MSEYEEREVAHLYAYRWDDWNDLPVIERAATVAHYRISGLIRLGIDEAGEEWRRRQEQIERNRRANG